MGGGDGGDNEGGGDCKKNAISPFVDASGNKKYLCYYSYRSRDSLSPVCGIFIYIFSSSEKVVELLDEVSVTNGVYPV